MMKLRFPTHNYRQLEAAETCTFALLEKQLERRFLLKMRIAIYYKVNRG